MPGIPGAGGAHPLFDSHGNVIQGPAVNPVTMGYYYDGLVELAQGAGFTASEASTMGAIAMAESSGKPGNKHINTDGSIDYGLWQINSKANADILKMGDWSDPKTNARMAKAVYDRQGFKAWSSYNSGAYKNDYPAGFGQSLKDIAGLPGDAVKAAFNAVVDPWLMPLLNFLKTGAITVGAFLLAVLLFLGGLSIMFRKNLVGATAQGGLKTLEGGKKAAGVSGANAYRFAKWIK